MRKYQILVELEDWQTLNEKSCEVEWNGDEVTILSIKEVFPNYFDNDVIQALKKEEELLRKIKEEHK